MPHKLSTVVSDSIGVAERARLTPSQALAVFTILQADVICGRLILGGRDDGDRFKHRSQVVRIQYRELPKFIYAISVGYSAPDYIGLTASCQGRIQRGFKGLKTHLFGH